MSLFFKAPVRRLDDGNYEVNVDEGDRRVLRALLARLRDLLLTDDPVLRRLFPPAYAHDAERDEDYQRLMKGELIESRFAAIETMEWTLDEKVLTEATLTRWMLAINSLRLVLGTHLDVSESPSRPDPEDPEYEMTVLYELLGYWLGCAVDALSRGLPEPGEASG